ncbi:hypothetical protein TRIUR3_25464 [Triticum urartu]|uniref:Uncharacterized protein n=1 Tax=Triticum urartu TaxID=4572 RepID=M7ZGV6_TRIUA|nr:hypothetical protein TRIUR3_25464 [Triticum urartu]
MTDDLFNAIEAAQADRKLNITPGGSIRQRRLNAASLVDRLIRRGTSKAAHGRLVHRRGRLWAICSDGDRTNSRETLGQETTQGDSPRRAFCPRPLIVAAGGGAGETAAALRKTSCSGDPEQQYLAGQSSAAVSGRPHRRLTDEVRLRQRGRAKPVAVWPEENSSEEAELRKRRCKVQVLAPRLRIDTFGFENSTTVYGKPNFDHHGGLVTSTAAYSLRATGQQSRIRVVVFFSLKN